MRIIDSHTEGEPTRVIIEGGPDLGTGPLAQRLQRFAAEFDAVRSFAVNEPRGNDAVVGALLCEPVNKDCIAGIIFFNNVGYLGMCGHGAIGVAATLAHMGRIAMGTHRFETPVGEVAVNLIDRNTAEIENVASYRHRANVSVEVAGLGTVTGDIAWGGNWFFLCHTTPHALTLANVGVLTRAAQAVSDALVQASITGADGAKIDHIEFFGAGVALDANSRNFVLCPGGAYDRSPCGTGTSAKLACLAADGKLAPGHTWVQESIVGSRFMAHYRWETSQSESGRIIPSVRGRAFVVAEATLLRDANDPFADGMRG
jgi:4-hydroxyproline epimerase